MRGASTLHNRRAWVCCKALPGSPRLERYLELDDVYAAARALLRTRCRTGVSIFWKLRPEYIFYIHPVSLSLATSKVNTTGALAGARLGSARARLRARAALVWQRRGWDAMSALARRHAPGLLLPAACTIETWFILPVVIRSSQRLSHACLSISKIQ